ncbi:hypothetical protein ACIBCN_41475 [Nocardia sp. NPDC051052]|uniref:hypothetical protein n=1 Tax=Nocardia sp. NPDC051052 TaxID=3364322 RepID=UPI00379F26FB
MAFVDRFRPTTERMLLVFRIADGRRTVAMLLCVGSALTLLFAGATAYADPDDDADAAEVEAADDAAIKAAEAAKAEAVRAEAAYKAAKTKSDAAEAAADADDAPDDADDVAEAAKAETTKAAAAYEAAKTKAEAAKAAAANAIDKRDAAAAGAAADYDALKNGDKEVWMGIAKWTCSDRTFPLEILEGMDAAYAISPLDRREDGTWPGEDFRNARPIVFRGSYQGPATGTEQEQLEFYRRTLCDVAYIKNEWVKTLKDLQREGDKLKPGMEDPENIKALYRCKLLTYRLLQKWEETKVKPEGFEPGTCPIRLKQDN